MCDLNTVFFWSILRLDCSFLPYPNPLIFSVSLFFFKVQIEPDILHNPTSTGLTQSVLLLHFRNIRRATQSVVGETC